MKERTRRPPDKSMPPVEKPEQPTKGQLSQDIQRKIGLQLRAMYTNVVNEGVPDRFAELIRRLDKQEPNNQGLNNQGLNNQGLNNQDLNNQDLNKQDKE